MTRGRLGGTNSGSEVGERCQEAAGKGLDAARGKPLSLSFVPAEFTAPVNSYAVPITGFLLILSGL